jgi:hypothetical protein
VGIALSSINMCSKSQFVVSKCFGADRALVHHFKDIINISNKILKLAGKKKNDEIK